MAEIIRKRERILVESYCRSFTRKDDTGCGFGFTCNKEGEIDREFWNPVAEENLRKCIDGTYDVIDNGIQNTPHSYWQSAVCRCHCGREVELYDAMTNDCECGQLFNGSGQELASRDQWEENWDEDY